MQETKDGQEGHSVLHAGKMSDEILQDVINSLVAQLELNISNWAQNSTDTAEINSSLF